MPEASKVMLDGKVVCTATPCSVREVPPGKHTVVVENAKQRLTQTRDVTVLAGDNARMLVDLAQSPVRSDAGIVGF